MWTDIKGTLKTTPLLGDMLYSVKHLLNYYVAQDFGGMNAGEIAVFDAIKGDIGNLFDVGARFNTDYADCCAGLDVELHLFEPNPLFFNKLKRLLGNRRRVHLHNVGLSNEPGEVVYYRDTQSFVKNHHAMESRLPGRKLPVTTISAFCREAGIEHIDFLKVDAEALDYHVLLGGLDIIQRTCRYCQVEIGIDAPLGTGKVTARHYVDFFADNFTLHLVRDARHPICAEIPGLPVLAPYVGEAREAIEHHLDRGYGPNLFAIRRGMALPIPLHDLLAG